jgi:TolB protein
MGQSYSSTTRRSVLLGGSSLLALGATQTLGQQRPPATDDPPPLVVENATIRPRPIAIPDFLGDDPQLGRDLASVIAADLDRSGLFKPLDSRAFIERLSSIDQVPNYASWRSIGAEALLVGRAYKLPDGRLGADFRIWDTVLGRAIDGQRVSAPPQQWRRLAHIAADRVYEKLTLEKGYFDTQVVFVDETGPKDRRLKRLAIMDQDGHNVRLLSQGRELVLTPRFAPRSQEIVFMQYVNQQGRVALMNLETGNRETIGNLPGTTFAPRFAPDGQRIIMSIQDQGTNGLLEYDLRSRQVRRVTQGGAIDTGPSYSPDGRRIVFESDRDGTQQLFVLDLGSGQTQRISRGEGRYATPVWSPRGDYIAFTKQTGGRFLIGVMAINGSGERILSDGFHNEGPTWAPNGRVVMFFRESQGANGGPKLFTVDITGTTERAIPSPSFASDPAWSPLRG